MIEYVSKSVRKYLDEKHIELDDKLKYALIIGSEIRYPLDEIKESLRELAGMTDDEEVKKQAEIWIRNEDMQYEVFARDSGPNYFYKIQYYDRHDDTVVVNWYYKSLALAIDAGVKTAADEKVDEFEIYKDFRASSKEQAEDIEDFDSETIYDLANGRFRADGKMLCCSAHVAKPLETIEDPIEERYFIIPHPFRRGDIVRSLRDKDGGKTFAIILEHEDDEMSAQKDRLEDLKKYCSPSYDDVSIYLVRIDLETGLIWDNDSPVKPSELEYYPIADDTEDLGERILLVLSDLIKGKPASLQYIQNGLMKLREEYDNKQRYYLITGLSLKKSQMGYVFD